MNDDQQIAEFRNELEGLAGYDVDVIGADLADLLKRILDAPTHDYAAVEIREFVDARPHAAAYAQAVVGSVTAQLGLYITHLAPLDALPGPDGLLRRLQRIAYAVRGLGFGGARV